MRVGIVSPYFDTIGGGERYMFTLAKFFLDHGDRVDIFSGKKTNANIISDFFGLDLNKANFVRDVFFDGGNFWQRLAVSAKYDLIVFLSDGSIPATLAKDNWLHFQTPFQLTNQKTLINSLKLSRFSGVICNSKFTKRFIDKTYGLNSLVVYPPVDVEKFRGKRKKENIILSTGRFSDPENKFQHAKRQELLIKTFQELEITGWRLVLAGSAAKDSLEYTARLTQMAKGHTVSLVANPKFGELQDYYLRAKIFWHAVGFEENLEENPARAEHFGITTVEAMAASVVPVVFAGGGQKEIVEDDKSGFLWETTKEFKNKTLRLIQDDKLRQRLALSAVQRSKNFSVRKFYENLEKLLNR